jgi:hypothetical protein
MSFEGYYQLICANGHYRTCDSWFSPEGKCSCGAEYKMINLVDQTNGPDEGIINLDDLKIKDAIRHTCSCGHVHIVEEAIFRIPSQKEKESLRNYSSCDDN